MKDALQTFKKVGYDLPDKRWEWRLYGAGLESLGREGKPEQVPMPKYGQDELLVRIDAVGICFSDIKVINQGNKHPRVVGRDLTVDPVTLGHEAAVTVVGIGDDLKKRFKVGDRFIVQADVFYKGKSMAFGYAIPGAQAQYQVIPHQMIEGDEGCYLLPLKEDTGYAEAALTEPWACVVASYRITRRPATQPGGVLWIIGAPDSDGDYSLGMEINSKVVLATGLKGKILEELKSVSRDGGFTLVETPPFASMDIKALASGYEDFDDIVVLGAASDVVEKAACFLKANGAMNIVAAGPMPSAVKIDIGKIHYQNHAFLGTSGRVIGEGYKPVRMPSELKTDGTAWFIGGGGPMGQMHVQRAVELENGPKKIIATDIDTARLNSVKQRFMPIAERRGIELQVVNPNEMSREEFDQQLRDFTGGKGFDDIVVLAPVAALIEGAAPYLGAEGLMNIFAGVPIGTIASMDLTPVYSRQARFVGSSGSKISDLKDTLDAAESGRLSTNTSVAAIGGMEASWDGMLAVKEGKFPGRVVIYPHIHCLPLTAVQDLGNLLPSVHEKLTDGMFWNREAEAELMRTAWEPEAPKGGCKPFKGKSAIVTGGGQGLGEAIARRLASEGANVVLADINLDAARNAAKDITEKTGVRAVAVKVDVTNDEQAAVMVRKAVEEFGKLDLMVCNAAILIAGDATEFATADWRKVIDVNLVGYFVSAREAAKVMVKQGFGNIIQINSKSGKKGSFKNSAYAASKFGGVGLTQSLALELAPHNIRVNAVCPGNLLDSPLWVDSLYEQYAKRWNTTVEEVRRKYTEQVPLGRGCTYEDVTNVVVFLASDQSSYMTGQAINITGGQEMG